MKYLKDCRHFVGYKPCRPHKESGVHCFTKENQRCGFYDNIERHILVIKLGAAGDVVRTTSLLHGLRKKYDASSITWLTLFPDLVPRYSPDIPGVDYCYGWNDTSLTIIRSQSYDTIINLDKDFEAVGLMRELTVANPEAELFGFTLEGNRPAPVNALAEHKYLTGLFDDLNQACEKSYPEEIYEICGLPYARQEYVLPEYVSYDAGLAKDAVVVGLNTGCGKRWVSRLWARENWVELTNRLQDKGFAVLLLGGPDEDEQNRFIAEVTGARYEGLKPLPEFIGLMDNCSIVVSLVTMAMHLAIGLKKRLVLMNNIFNSNEFELYGRGEIVEPDVECTCFFQPRCTNEEYRCMEHLSVKSVLEGVINQFTKEKKNAI